MAFNGSGAFARLFSWRTDRANGVDIDSTRMDQEMDGMADGLSNCMTRDGQSTIIGDIPFNNQKITGLADAAAATDAMNRQSSDARYTPRVSTKTANYTLLAADIGSLIVGTGTWTLTLLPAATAGNGFSFQIRNSGSGIITVDPDAAEAINGATTLLVTPGQDLHVVSDGSGWVTVGNTLWKPLARIKPGSGGLANVDLAIPAGAKTFRIQGRAKIGTTQQLFLRVSLDGGLSYRSGSTDYSLSYLFQSNNIVSGLSSQQGSAFILTDYSDAPTLSSLLVDTDLHIGDVSISTVADSKASGYRNGSGGTQLFYSQFTTFQDVPTHLRFLAASGNILEGTDFAVEYL